MDLEIEKMLLISTCHLSQTDLTLLTEPSTHPYPYTTLTTEYGVIVFVVTDMVLPPKENSIDFITDKIPEEWVKHYTKEFIEVLRIAQANGISWVNFDRDGSVYNELHKFDW